MNKTRRSHRGGFSLFKKNKPNKKTNKNTFAQENPILAKKRAEEQKQKAKKEANNLVKGLNRLGFGGGRRTRKQRS